MVVILQHFHMDKLIRNGVVLMWVTAIYCLLIATLIPLTYWSLVILVVLIYLSSSALFANSSAQAFHRLVKALELLQLYIVRFRSLWLLFFCP